MTQLAKLVPSLVEMLELSIVNRKGMHVSKKCCPPLAVTLMQNEARAAGNF
jgi:hypothetical protein